MERDKNEDKLIEQVKQSVLACWLGGWQFLREEQLIETFVLTMCRICFSFVYQFYIQVLSGYIRLYHDIPLSGRFLLPLASCACFLYIFKRND